MRVSQDIVAVILVGVVQVLRNQLKTWSQWLCSIIPVMSEQRPLPSSQGTSFLRSWIRSFSIPQTEETCLRIKFGVLRPWAEVKVAVPCESGLRFREVAPGEALVMSVAASGCVLLA